MQFHKKYLSVLIKAFLLFVPTLPVEQIAGQVKMKPRSSEIIQQNQIERRANSTFQKTQKEIQIDSKVERIGIEAVRGNEKDAMAYLATKAGCESEKTIDDNGCVIIQYQDGGSKKLCNGTLSEIVTPNGKKFPIRTNTIRQFVMKLEPPQNPHTTDVSYKWISSFNSEVLSDIKQLLSTENALKQYLKRENASCNGNLYKQLEYRTIFLQEYLKAK